MHTSRGVLALVLTMTWGSGAVAAKSKPAPEDDWSRARRELTAFEKSNTAAQIESSAELSLASADKKLALVEAMRLDNVQSWKQLQQARAATWPASTGRTSLIRSES